MTEPCGLVGASEGNGANKIRMQFKDFCERRRCRMHSKAATHVEIAYLIFNGENTRGFDVKLRDNAQVGGDRKIRDIGDGYIRTANGDNKRLTNAL